jgi:hypothetical protein
MILALVLAQAVSVPAAPRSQLDPPIDSARLSIVVADTVSETDPQPLCDGATCRSLYLGRYANSVVLAGPPLPRDFSARVEMGSPFNGRYRIALIVEHREGLEPLVRSMAGFGDRSHEACFDWRDTAFDWPVSGPRIVKRRRVVCVAE